MADQKRKITSQTMAIIETQSFGDYKITYSYSTYTDGFVGSVNFNVQRQSEVLPGMATSGGSASGNYSVSGCTNSFSGMDYDGKLIDEVIKNAKEITAGDAELIEKRKTSNQLV